MRAGRHTKQGSGGGAIFVLATIVALAKAMPALLILFVVLAFVGRK